MERNSWLDERLAVLDPTSEWQSDVTRGLLRFRELQERGSWHNRRRVLAAAAAVGVSMCLMVLPSPTVLAHRCLECSISVLERLSSSTPVQEKLKPESDRAFAPAFNLKDASGRDVKLTEFRGDVLLLNFWATWCEGCQVEIPWFVEFQKQYKDNGLVVIGISMDEDGWKSVRPWIGEKGVNYSVVIGNDGLAKQYGLEGMPLTVLVDRDGRIADVNRGIVDKAATQQKIRALLQESAKTK